MKRRQIGFIKIICVEPKLVVSYMMCHRKTKEDDSFTGMRYSTHTPWSRN